MESPPRREITWSQREDGLPDHTCQVVRHGSHRSRQDAFDIELSAPIQEQQQGQERSARQQDFQHEIRAQRLPESTQHR